MNYADFFGYLPLAPTLTQVPTTGQAPANAQSTAANTALAGAFGGPALAGDFSVSGWLVVGILALVGLRVIYELAEG